MMNKKITIKGGAIIIASILVGQTIAHPATSNRLEGRREIVSNKLYNEIAKQEQLTENKSNLLLDVSDLNTTYHDAKKNDNRTETALASQRQERNRLVDQINSLEHSVTTLRESLMYDDIDPDTNLEVQNLTRQLDDLRAKLPNEKHKTAERLTEARQAEWEKDRARQPLRQANDQLHEINQALRQTNRKVNRKTERLESINNRLGQ